MKAYIINLARSKERRTYMEDLLSSYNSFETVFVEGVDGTHMTDQDIELVFNQDGATRIYGRQLINTEVGCLLSHLKCAELFLKSGDNSALIFEDDLVLNDCEKDFDRIVKSLSNAVEKSDHPMIIIMSGDYWWTSRRESLDDRKHELVKVREAVCAQAYCLNRMAASILVKKERVHLADDWYSIAEAGIDVIGIYPHVADQNRADFRTVISEAYDGVHRKNMPFLNMVKSYYRAIVKRFLVYIGHFESKRFKE